MFNVGDKVVCVNRFSKAEKYGITTPQLKTVYVIKELGTNPPAHKAHLGRQWLKLHGVPKFWDCRAFRKLVNDKPEAAIGTFAEWLNVKEKTDV